MLHEPGHGTRISDELDEAHISADEEMRDGLDITTIPRVMALVEDLRPLSQAEKKVFAVSD